MNTPIIQNDPILTNKIKLEQVSKGFEYQNTYLPVLSDIDFRVEEGEFVTLIGPSGCGKSTLLNIIAGLDHPQSGNLYLNGKQDSNPLGKVAYMQQKDLLLPWRTVLDNTIIGVEIQGVSRIRARAKAMELMEGFGLKGFENEYPSSLSGGMRQRAAFLRTVMTETEIILLDEPFGALDALTRTQMQEWLINLWTSFHKTVVLVTHDIEEALFLSDRIYVLSKRPGTVTMVLDVNITRPRSYQTVMTETFIKLKNQLLTSIRFGEDIK